MASDGIVTGCGEGLERNRAAIRIMRRMMPLIMSKGRRDRLDIYQPVLSGEVEGLLHTCGIGSARWANEAWIGCIGDHVLYRCFHRLNSDSEHQSEIDPP